VRFCSVSGPDPPEMVGEMSCAGKVARSVGFSLVNRSSQGHADSPGFRRLG
jgi:hypothetical protein